MHILRSTAILFFVFLLAASSFALNWENTLNLAAQKSNEIKSSQKLLESYRWSYYKSFSSFLPQISANMSTSGFLVTSESNYAYGLSVSQSLFSGLGNYYDALRAATNVDYYQASLKNTEANVFYNTRSYFIDLYIAEKNLALQQTIVEYRRKNARMVKLFYESGKEDEGNMRRTEAQLANAEYNVSAGRRQLELAQLKLSQMLEIDALSAEGTSEADVPLLVDFDALLAVSPSYLMAKTTLDLADIAQKATVSEFLPNISLMGSYQRSGSNWPPGTASKALSLSLSYPFFPGGSNIADRAIYGMQLDKAREDFAKSRKDLVYNLQKAYDDFRNAVEAYATQKIFLAALEEQARIYQMKYMNGLASYYEWDQVQTECINNESSILNYQKNMLLAEANWYKSYGGWVK